MFRRIAVPVDPFAVVYRGRTRGGAGTNYHGNPDCVGKSHLAFVRRTRLGAMQAAGRKPCPRCYFEVAKPAAVPAPLVFA